MQEEIKEEKESLPPTVTPEGDVEEAPPAEDTAPSEENGGEEADFIDYEALAAKDLAEIKRLDPSYAPAAHLSELPFARRFHTS